jgi:hypothetical protein
MTCMQKVYLETTVASYLAAKASRDLIIAAHQQITQDWWQTAVTDLTCMYLRLCSMRCEPVTRKLSRGVCDS